MVLPISNKIKNSKGSVKATSRKTSKQATVQKQQKKSRKRLFTNIFVGVFSTLIIALGVFLHFYEQSPAENSYAGSLIKVTNHGLDLPNIESKLTGGMYSPLGQSTVQSTANLTGIPHAFDQYFRVHGQQACKNIAANAGVSVSDPCYLSLPKLSNQDMAKFMVASKSYDNGAIFKSAESNLELAAKVSTTDHVDGGALIERIAAGNFKAVEGASLDAVTRWLVAEGYAVEDIQKLINEVGGINGKTKVTIGNINLDASGAIISGNAVFPDFHHGANLPTNRAIGFSYSKGIFDGIIIESTQSDSDIIMIQMRDGMAILEGSSLYYTNDGKSEAIIEPAVVGKLSKASSTSVFTSSISKECSYNSGSCVDVPPGATVHYKVIVRVKTGTTGNLNVADYTTSGVLEEVKNVDISKTGGTNDDEYWIYEDGHQIKWWIGGMDAGHEAVLEYDSVLKDTLTNNQNIENLARLLVYRDSTSTNEIISEVENNFHIYSQSDSPTLEITKNCTYESSPCVNVPAGQDVQYTIRVTARDANAASVNVRDYYDPAEINRIVSGLDADHIEYEDGQLRWWIGNLNENGTATWTYTMELEDDLVNGRRITNIAEAYIGYDKKDQAEKYFFINNPAADQPDLEISKSCTYNGVACASTDVPAGETVNYTIVVVARDADAEDVYVRDYYDPAEIDSIVSGLDVDHKIHEDGQMRWWIGDMDENDSVTWRYSARLEDNLGNGRTIINIAEAYIYPTRMDTDEYRFVVTNPVVVQPDLEISKSCTYNGVACASTDVPAGETVNYTIVVVARDADAEGVYVRDYYDPAEISSIPTGLDSDHRIMSDGELRWWIGDLSQNQSATWNYQAELESGLATGRTITNIADAYIGDIEMDDVRYDFVITNPTVNSEPELRITKSCTYNSRPCNDPSVPQNAVVTYTLLVENYGDATATGVQIADDYPQNDIDIINSGGATDNGTVLVFTLGNIGVNANESVSYTARVQSDVAHNQSITNTAVVTGTNVNQDADDTDTYTFPVELSAPELDIQKSCTYNGSDCASQNLINGNTVTYSLTIVNNGQQTATNVTISDDYPETRLTVTDAMVNNGGDENNGVINWTLGSLLADQTTTLTYTATLTNVSAGDRIENIAVVDADNADSDSDTYVFDVGGSVALDLTKTCYAVEDGNRTDTRCQDATLQAGDTIEYIVEVTNNGTDTAVGIDIVDDYPEAYLVNISYPTNSPEGILNNGVINWINVFDLAPGVSDTVNYRADIADDVMGGTTVRNLAIATDNTGMTAEDDEEFVTRGKRVVISKTCVVKGTADQCNTVSMNNGDEIVYTITVHNPGPDAIDNVELVVDDYDETKLTNITAITLAGVNNEVDGTITWTNLGALSVNGSTTMSFEATVDGALNGDRVVNLASVIADGLQANTTYTFNISIPYEHVVVTGAFSTGLIISLVAALAGGTYYVVRSKKTGSLFGGARSKEV